MADKNYSRELFYKALRKSATLGYNPQDVADLYWDHIKNWQNEWDLHTQKFPHQHFYDRSKIQFQWDWLIPPMNILSN